jgi:hypothetical protein
MKLSDPGEEGLAASNQNMILGHYYNIQFYTPENHEHQNRDTNKKKAPVILFSSISFLQTLEKIETKKETNRERERERANTHPANALARRARAQNHPIFAADLLALVPQTCPTVNAKLRGVFFFSFPLSLSLCRISLGAFSFCRNLQKTCYRAAQKCEQRQQ